MLYVAAKAPLAGEAKTRLEPALGPSGAAALYRGFLRDLAARFVDAPYPVSWYVAPGAWAELEPLVGAGWNGVLEQGPGDWTERQRTLFRDAAGRGERPVVLIASDSPHLSVETVGEAFALLEGHDVVLGPVLDGGYYLIGMNGWHDVLAGVGMSTATVLDEIAACCRSLGCSLALLEATFDVDVAGDLPRLRRALEDRADLPWTAAALAAATGGAR